MRKEWTEVSERNELSTRKNELNARKNQKGKLARFTDTPTQ